MIYCDVILDFIWFGLKLNYLYSMIYSPLLGIDGVLGEYEFQLRQKLENIFIQPEVLLFDPNNQLVYLRE